MSHTSPRTEYRKIRTRKISVLGLFSSSVKVYLKAHIMELRVYLFRHLDQWYDWSSWSENQNTICSEPFQSLVSWPIGFWVIKGLLQLLGSLGSLIFHLFLVSIGLAYTSRNPMSTAFPCKLKWKKSETYN